MTVAVADRLNAVGPPHPPQMAPPLPLQSKIEEFVSAATMAGITLMPWQHLAARYLTATTKDGWRYPEVAIIVPRQNGKTTMLLPRIVAGLLAGERIMHTAQNRELPREIFNLIADTLDPSLMSHPPRVSNGQERIDMLNGGVYRIVAPSRGGARGPSNDLVIVDEAREFETFDFVAGAKPTLTVSEHPQIMYLSNAGWDGSLVLNTLRRRGEKGDEDLAYIEWSAPSEYAVDDRTGWKIANPAHEAKPQLMAYLEREFRASMEGGTLSLFETEHLCRWVISMQPRVVSESAWLACRGTPEEPSRPTIGFNMDPAGKRASVVKAWLQTDGRIAIEEVIEAVGETAPIDVQRLGSDIKDLAVKKLAFASWTDKDLARYVPRAQAIDQKEFAAASEMFARYVSAGRIVWDTASHVTDDLAWTSRKPHESGSWMAVPASPERSVTAVLAAIRAVWLASAPRTVPRIG